MRLERPQLFVLPPSHFCERARWALDHIKLSYHERRLAVGLHVMRARRLAGSSTLPILVCLDEVVQGSGAILDWTGIKGGIPEIEKRFEERIGALVRQYIYAGSLDGKGSARIREMLFADVPFTQAIVGRGLWPVTKRLMISSMNARPALLTSLEQTLNDELEWFERKLVGRRYLLDGKFGRTDLTAASLLAPLARPTTHPVYNGASLPERLEANLSHWASRPSLRWVRQIYADHRS